MNPEQQEEFIDSAEVQETIDLETTNAVHSEDDDMEEGAEEEMVEIDANQNDLPAGEVQDDSVMGFYGHSDAVYALALHPSLPLAISGSGDDKAILWRYDNGEVKREITQHSDTIVAVAFSHDGLFVATGGMDGKIVVFKWNEPGEFVLDGPTEVTWLQWHSRGHVLLVGSSDGQIWMYNVGKNGAVMGVFAGGHGDTVSCGMFTPDGKHVVSGGSDGTMVYWDPNTFAAVFRFDSSDARWHQAPISALSVSPDSDIAFTGDQEGGVRVVNLKSGALVCSLEGHSDSIEAISFCSVLPYAITASVDGLIHIWDIKQMRLRGTCRHDDAVTQATFTSDHRFVSCSADRTVRVWDSRTSSQLKCFKGHTEIIQTCTWKNETEEGLIVASGSDDSSCLVFQL